MEEALVRVVDLCKVYNPGENEVRALDHVNLEIHKGEFVAIIGQSGSGKSTFMNMLGCLDVPTSGKYYLNGTDVSTMKDNDLSVVRNKEIGFIFQGFNLIANLTAIENVELPLIYRGIDRKTRRKLAVESLKKVGLEKRMDHKPNEMSGGQQQRVGVARAFATDSDLILMDEPFSALDPLTREELQDEIVKLQKEYQKTIVFVTHDMDEAIKCADKICFIQNGTVIQFDKTEEILRHPANDYVEKFVGKNRLWGNPKYIHASDIMCKEPYTLSKDRTVIQALQVMRQNAINSIFITEGKSRGFLGIVWLEDLSKLDVQHMSASIGDMISSDYVSVYEESSLQEIIDEIDYYKSGIIPVLNERRELKGALTKSILLSTLSKRYKKEQEG